jgi:hypothetical protein
MADSTRTRDPRYKRVRYPQLYVGVMTTSDSRQNFKACVKPPPRLSSEYDADNGLSIKDIWLYFSLKMAIANRFPFYAFLYNRRFADATPVCTETQLSASVYR